MFSNNTTVDEKIMGIKYKFFLRIMNGHAIMKAQSIDSMSIKKVFILPEDHK